MRRAIFASICRVFEVVEMLAKLAMLADVAGKWQESVEKGRKARKSACWRQFVHHEEESQFAVPPYMAVEKSLAP